MFPEMSLRPKTTKTTQKHPKPTPKHNLRSFKNILDLTLVGKQQELVGLAFCTVNILCNERRREKTRDFSAFKVRRTHRGGSDGGVVVVVVVCVCMWVCVCARRR